MKEVTKNDYHKMLEVQTAGSNQIWIDKFLLLISYINNTIFENFLKLWMFVMKRAHLMQLAGKNNSAIFLGVKNTF